MAMTMKILMFLISIIQFLFPFVDIEVPELPEEETTEIVEEIPTEEQPTFDGCRHAGGEATCNTLAVCELCGEEYGTASGHKYMTNVTPATCTTDGFTTYKCMHCTYSYVGDEKTATGHNYKSRVIDPTCTAEGRTAYVCENCGDSYGEDTVPALGHNYVMTEVLPDCVNPGKYVYTCSRCSDSYYEENDKPLGHNYVAVVTAPTCKNKGYTTYTCPGCNDYYTDNIVDALGHSFTNYLSDNNASCRNDGTKTAYCDNGCGLTSTLIDTGSKLPHSDSNRDKHCDYGGEEMTMEFTHLTYDATAVRDIGDWGLTLEQFLARADKNDDVYVAAQGYVDTCGIIKSPYYTAKIEGVSVPVYGALTYVGETGKGSLHSFSEIYVEKGKYSTFEIEIFSAALNITDAKIIPASLGESVTVKDGKATAILSGYGAHTFMFNGDNQAYTYTVFVREEVDEEAEIQALTEAGYEVLVFSGYNLVKDPIVFSSPSVTKKVVYLRRGAYLMANHKFDINSDADNQGNPETLENGAVAAEHNGIGLNRFPFISAHNTSNIKVMGYGALDLSHLDRGERRGLVFSFANNIEVRGIKIINAPEWSFITYRCDEVTVKDVDIFGYRTNSDAFDICNSTDVTVTGCFARTGDDIFGVKALNGDANAITDNITFSNCYAWAGKARAFGIFGECNRNINNVTFRDSYVLVHDATWDENRIPAIGIVVETTNPDNGAIKFSNITFENIEICRNDAAAMNCLIYNGVNNFTIENLQFRNISYTSNRVLNRIVNYGGSGSNNSIQAVFENIKCGNTNVVDSNKTQYFSEESYHGNYITVK